MMAKADGIPVRPDGQTKGVGAIAYAALMAMLGFIAWQTVENRGDIAGLKESMKHVIYRLEQIENKENR